MLSFSKFLIERSPEGITLYHGTGRNFDKFSPEHSRIKNDNFGGGVGYFTSDHDAAKVYAKSAAKSQKTNSPTIYHTRLNLKNVFDTDDKYSGEHLKKLLPDEKHHETFARGAGLLNYGSDKYSTLAKLKTGNHSLSGHQIFKGLSAVHGGTSGAREHLMKKGYDGLRYTGGGIEVEGKKVPKHDVYLPYKHDSIHIDRVENLNN